MKELFGLNFQNLGFWVACAPLHYDLAFKIEGHIDKLNGRVPNYMAEAIGCRECPAVKAGKQCILNTSVGPMPGKHEPDQDIPQFLKFACSGIQGGGYRPCMQGFNVGIQEVHQAERDGVKPFTLNVE